MPKKQYKTPIASSGPNIERLVACPDTLGRNIRAVTLLGVAIALALILFSPLL